MTSARRRSAVCNDYWWARFWRTVTVPGSSWFMIMQGGPFASSPPHLLRKFAVCAESFPTVNPARRNLIAIQGCVRLGGLLDDPQTDPWDWAWFRVPTISYSSKRRMSLLSLCLDPGMVSSLLDNLLIPPYYFPEIACAIPYTPMSPFSHFFPWVMGHTTPTVSHGSWAIRHRTTASYDP